MTQAVDRLNLSEPDAAQEYRALVRALRRKQGFGLFFVQASPAKGQEILTDLRRDLPQKKVAEVTIRRADDRLFDQLEAMWEREPVDIFWIEGLEQSLLAYEDMQRLAGWDEQDLMTYSWKDVPPILSHLNLGRERFEAQFDCAVVFVVPLFVVKYLLRRAGDFFDWKSGFFEFPDDRQKSANQMIEDADYAAYLKLDYAERTQKILQIKDLLDAPEIGIDRRASLLWEIGRLFASRKDAEQAIVSYEKSLQVKPSLSEAWNSKGNALLSLGRYGEAIASYERAIELNPNDAMAYDNLGTTYKVQRLYGQAITAHERAIELDPKSAYPYSSLGNLYQEQQLYDRAIAAYQRAVELEPKFPAAYNGLGIIYSHQNRYEDAISAYNQAVNLNSRYSAAYNNLGIIYARKNEYEKATANFSEALECSLNTDFSHKTATIYYNLSIAYANQNEPTRAISARQKAVDLNPKYANAPQYPVNTPVQQVEADSRDDSCQVIITSSDVIAWKNIEISNDIIELSDHELENIGSERMHRHASNANFERHRVSMSGVSFTGPEGAGSSFSLKEEDISASSLEFMSD
jgi:tetratricopeptide (TPR) repeat protein